VDLWSGTIRDAHGEHIGTVGVIADITERKQAEEALRRSEELYRSLFENMLNGFAYCQMQFDGQGRPCDFTYLAVNKAFETLTGLRDVVGKSASEVIPGIREADPELLEVYGRVARSGRPERLEMFAKSLQMWFWISVYSPEPGHFTAIFDVITDRKRAEEALRESEERFRKVFEQGPIGVAMLSLDYRWVSVNAKLCEMLGYSEDELVKLTFVDVTHPDDINEDLDKSKRLLSGEIPVKKTVKRYIRKNGETLWVGLTATLVRDEQGQPIYMLAMIEDISERKRVEEALRESEERYRIFFETSRDCVFMTTVDGLFVDVNDVALDVFGYPLSQKHELLQRKVAGFYANPEERDAISAMLADIGFAKEFPVDLRKSDGTIIHALVTTVARKDPHGKVIGFQGTVRDITEQKRADELLRTTLQRFYTILSSLYAGALIVTEEGRIEFANQAFCNLFDLDVPPESLHGLAAPDMIARIKDVYAHPAEAVARIREVVAKHQPVKGEQIAMRGGRTYMVDYVPLIVDGKGSGRLWYHNDITYLKKAEEKLRETGEYLQSLIDYANAPIIVWDPQLKITRFNRAFEALTGRKAEDVIGHSLDILFPRDRVEPSMELIHRTLKGERWETVEINILTVHGAIRTVLWNSATILAADGLTPVATIAQGVDITYLKKAEEERESFRDQLLQAQKMEAIGTLTGGIAHDFNNLLTIINGFAEIILMEKTEDDPNYADLQKILQTGQKGADIVQRLLSFTRQATPKLEPSDLNQRIEESKKLMEATFPKMIEIETILSDDLWMVNADTGQIDQVIMNLCLNAKDAMPDGGRLRIETRNMTVDEDYCRLNIQATPGRYVLVEVSDTGAGMSAETMARIFDPFFTTKGWDFRKGTGLGLPVVKGIVEQHGGWITCISEIGAGSKFAVHFPAIEKSPEVRQPETAVEKGPGGQTILLVDDEKYVRDLGKRILERSAYTVITATNGKEALDIYAREQAGIALVVLDMVMPKMEGKQCLERLLKIDPHVKVIISSGFSLDAEERERLGAFVKGFVNKPYEVSELVRAVKEALGSGGTTE
jgi:two-component system, cell cycle sensor histidine kinase and response regulator CckA